MNLKNITPVMTYENRPTPYIVTQSSFRENKAWNAFNPNKTEWRTASNNKIVWADFNFASNTIVDAFKIVLHTYQVPKTIVLYGTNDNGVTLEEIKTFTDLKPADYPLTRKIPRSNYKKYRLSFTEASEVLSGQYKYDYYVYNIYYYEDLDYVGTSEKIKAAVVNVIKNNQKLIDNSIKIEIDGGE